MNTPDYISPIVGYRTWQWDNLGLKSLNGERWVPGEPLEARCMDFPLVCALNAPQERCSCGIYAAKNAEHLVEIGYMRHGEVHGEVYLWGKVWDHHFGYRAQYAYPKTIVLPPQMTSKADEVESRLEPLIAYGVDIFIVALQEGASKKGRIIESKPSSASEVWDAATLELKTFEGGLNWRTIPVRSVFLFL